ncbi:uncharacterized protein PHACADRAFT_250104 [Phanerochaete carnosa HHB-10118-sp]|uniref:Uncharacterized protein n=1 Tax=Phanerochaete carnosa (strain HHB-10118-sp) TaxID=650164 RepID=K5V9M0_PHACS|nr:uncharacterized protein PHACADRAFT_250104 [Phanerochaete carnosa HHB-10118-sp]EKM59536.1 hypothetical protein PHACADRAFT_250104 [Phanerochaete carnosa HHB-10118-sp]
MNGPPFIAPQSQPGQPPQAQQPHPSMLNANPPPPMGMLTGAQPNANGPNPYQGLHMQANRVQAPPHRNPMMHPMQGMNPGMGSNQSLVNGLGPSQLQNIPFPNSIPGPIRRAPSQPNMMNQGGVPGLHPGQPAMAGMSMAGMSGITNMNLQQQQRMQQIRQQQHLQQQPQQPGQGQPQLQAPGGLPSDYMLGGRPGAQGGGFPPGARAQLMPGIPQPPNLPQSQQGGMQGPFTNSMSMSQQPQQMGTSPHPGHTNVAPNIANGLPGSNGMPPNGVQNRPRITPEPTFVGFQNGPMGGMGQGVPRMPATNGQFPFGHASTPPNGMGDLQQPMSSGRLGTPRPGNQQPLMPTPAQALEISQNGGENNFNVTMGMPPPAGPARPPSQQRPHPGFQLPQQQPPQQQPHPRQQTPLAAHTSPRQPQQGQQLHGQRPQSQPQAPQRQSPQQSQQPHQQQQQNPVPQPQPQPGPSRTPRMAQPPLPPNMAVSNRVPPLAAQHQQPQQAQQGPPMSSKPSTPAVGPQQLPVAQNPPQGPSVPVMGQIPTTAPPRPPATAQQGQAQSQSQESGHNQQEGPKIDYTLPRGCPQFIRDARFIGLGIAFMERFNGNLTTRLHDMHSPFFWKDLIHAYFSSTAIFKFTLWKDGQKKEAKPFEIGVPILPRFFLVTVQSGVTAINFSLSGATELRVADNPMVCKVEIPRAAWTFTYANGYTVTLKGPLTAHMRIHPGAFDYTRRQQLVQPGYALQFEHFQFDGEIIEKSLSLNILAPPRTSESPSSGTGQLENEDERRDEPRNYIEHMFIPVEPVNAFGIPQATMRCLELAESVAQMADLFQYSREKGLGPLESLTHFAQMLRENGAGQGPPLVGNNMLSHHLPNYAMGGPGDMHPSGLPTSSSSALYQVPTANGQHPAPQQSQPGNATNADGTPKPGNAIPKTPQASGSTPGPSAATPAAAPTPTAATLTPVTTPATLKRKAGAEVASPTVSSQDPPSKRAARKRTRTQNGP